jgi:hypothetical protein
MAKGNNARKKEVKKPKKNSKVKGNGYSKNLTRTYPGTAGLPSPDFPGTGRPGSY